MGGKKYSAFVTLAVEAEDGRINNTAFTLKLDGIDTPLSTSQAQGVYTFPETEIVGYTVSGTATSFNSDTDEVIIQLTESGAAEASYEAVVKGNTASYSIADVPAGTYTMKVMKKNHVTREYTVTVGSADVTQNVKIHLLGDINGDGKVNMKDWGAVYAHVNETKLLTGYELKCAEVTGDGKVTMKDWNRIYAHVNETNPLW